MSRNAGLFNPQISRTNYRVNNSRKYLNWNNHHRKHKQGYNVSPDMVKADTCISSENLYDAGWCRVTCAAAVITHWLARRKPGSAVDEQVVLENRHNNLYWQKLWKMAQNSGEIVKVGSQRQKQDYRVFIAEYRHYTDKVMKVGPYWQKTRGPRGPWVAHLRIRSKVTVEPIIENPRGIIWTTLVKDL